MRKIAVFVLTLLAALLIAVPVYASDDIGVNVDGRAVEFEGQGPVIVDYRTLVPVRAVFEAAGFDVGWDDDTRTVTLTGDGHVVVIEIDSDTFTANGETHTLDVPAQIIGNSTMLPIRLVLESVGYYVDWDDDTRTVVVSSAPPGEPPAAVPELPVFTAESPFTPVTGWQMMERFGMGINIGNTLEARTWLDTEGDWWHVLDPSTDFETLWGEARIEQWHFTAIAKRGFSTVRIPVNWGARMDAGLRISPVFMDRVQQVVDWALAEGLYVIINAHAEMEFYYNLYERNYDEAERHLITIWEQIAEHFKYYPEQLIFEPMNEPHRGSQWYGDPVGQAEQRRVLSETVNRLNFAALNVIRNSGGNNGRRVVMLTTVQADADTLYLYEHPADDNYVMVGTFFYNWESRVEGSLVQIRAALENNIPVVIKESSPGINIWSEAEALTWSRRYYAELAALGVPSIWWNHGFRDNEGRPVMAFDKLFLRATGEWHEQMLEIFFAAYGATPGPIMERPSPFPYELPAVFTDGEFTSWRFWQFWQFSEAERVVIEYDGEIHSFSFARWTEAEGWVQYNYDSGNERITIEPGRIIFDIRGIEIESFYFAVWWPDVNTAAIRRVFLDVMP